MAPKKRKAKTDSAAISDDWERETTDEDVRQKVRPIKNSGVAFLAFRIVSAASLVPFLDLLLFPSSRLPVFPSCRLPSRRNGCVVFVFQ
jgi:hypothetical protein